jgi:hypothetical protein
MKEIFGPSMGEHLNILKRKKTCTGVTFCTANPKWISLGWNPSLRDEKAVSHETNTTLMKSEK